ncbi:hypothetical protein GCK72_019122 [Caenorhabditis remanei]|uniref:Uncharacterized protein n=1 Tax=Caenorhabditis remanei TaxID=31234 RepID=E3LKP4_CAERE|nr:hypothetical protein GCK72_019117 [Caenorhabditis remanei]XP_053581800.1 hypothetical protein GCK72_019122 [Caenorhabditis remanei]EFO99881.1 hypothetical protein CRE_18822 [Caenorhabditis remanei]KAF1752562.1 hypothetical protein GCK72_019117 [Caenorhabditis remanei]KAF1752567.1 hypothetical protein GCK72_019122 [Caenorhabditis remanei]
MSFGDHLILVQNIFLIVFVFCPTWILCKGKKKATGANTPSKRGSSTESLVVKSAIKPPVTDPSPSMLGGVKEEPKNEETKPAEGKTSGENKDAGAGDKEANDGSKDGQKEGAGSADDKTKENKDRSLKPFPKFEMPTESKKKKKQNDNEKDKKEKMKTGFYQEKSDEDDTLEKVESLQVEQSDKTKRSQKKKK